MDNDEIDYWCKEHPNLTREEVIETLELMEQFYIWQENDQRTQLD